MTERNGAGAGSFSLIAAVKMSEIVFLMFSTHPHLLLQLLVRLKGWEMKRGREPQPGQTVKAFCVASQ